LGGRSFPLRLLFLPHPPQQKRPLKSFHYGSSLQIRLQHRKKSIEINGLAVSALTSSLIIVENHSNESRSAQQRASKKGAACAAPLVAQAMKGREVGNAIDAKSPRMMPKGQTQVKGNDVDLPLLLIASSANTNSTANKAIGTSTP
jgi:hypothetical protein